ncbi:MAG: hypothetical protein ACR2HH_16180 [Chthoniobacterales bacterium]
MNETTNPPPQDRGLGCIGKGCLTFVGLIAFLCLAFVGGGYWALHHLRQKYSATEPLVLSAETNETEITSSAPEATPVSSAPTPPPVAVEKRWKAFEKADERDENANIALSAGEINALLNANKNTRGKAFVSIENDVGHVRVSIPLDKVFLMGGRYLNGEATVEASPDGNPAAARITNIVFKGERVPDSILDQRLFGWKSIRTYINDWLAHEQVTSFKIQNNRVLGQKNGRGNF